MPTDDAFAAFPDAPQPEQKNDPWAAFPDAPQPKAAQPAGGSNYVTPGESEYKSDKELIEKNQGVLPQEVKTFLYSTGNTALFNAPDAAIALYESYKQNRPYGETHEEQKRFVQALERQNPKASMAGVATGLIAPALVGDVLPLAGNVARGATTAAKTLGVGETGQAVARGSALGAYGSTLAGGIEKYDPAKSIGQNAQEVIPETVVGTVTGGVLGPAAEKLASKFATKAEITAANPEVSAAIDKAFGSRLSAEEKDALMPQFLKAFNEKGNVSPEKAKEAITSGFAPSSREIVTGQKAPEGGAAQQAQFARQEGTENIADYLKGQQTEQAPNQLAELYHAKERATYEPAATAAEEFKQTPGQFKSGPAWVGDTYQNEASLKDLIYHEVPAALQTEGRYATFDSDSKAAKAQQYLYSFAEGTTPYGGGFDARNIQAANKRLNQLYASAQGADRTDIGVLKQGFDNAVNKALESKLFSGDAASFLESKNNSRELWKNYMDTFYPKNEIESGFVNKIMGAMKGPDGFTTPVLDDGKAHAAQAAINQGLLNPDKGLSAYQKIEKTFGTNSPEMDSFRAAIRNNVFNAVDPKTGTFDLKQLVKQIDAHFQPGAREITLKAFGADAKNPASVKAAQDEMINLRKLREAAALISQNPKISPAEAQNKWLEAAKSIAPKIFGFAAGLPSGIEGALLGSAAGSGYQGARGMFKNASQIAAEKSGAPKANPSIGMRTPISMFNSYPGIKNVGAMFPVEESPGYGPAPVQRKHGGRVGGMTSDQLLSAVERAKKKTRANTKPMLGLHDNQVAQALEIANHKI